MTGTRARHGSPEEIPAGISTSSYGRWAPFPVQDWSTMPPAGAELLAPGEEPPRRFRRTGELVPLVILLALVLLICTAIYAADRHGRAGARSAALRYVPADGTVRHGLRSVGGLGAVPVTVESARYTAAEIASALDFTLSSRVLGAMHGDLGGHAFWRAITTQDSGTDQAQQTSVYAVDGAVELIAESWPGNGLVFQPGLVELPADVTPASTWRQSGSAGDGLRYDSTFRAEAAPGGCLRVTGELRLLDRTGPRGAKTQDQTWCPDSGVVSSSRTTDGVTEQTTAIDQPSGPGRLVTATPSYAWPQPSRWRSRSAGVVTVDPTFGEGQMTGSAAGLPPIVTASGRLFQVVSGAEDVAAFAPSRERPEAPAGPTWRVLWRLHPGGRVLSAVAFGDVVVASTDRRQLVAWTDRGVRLWTVDLAELAMSPPVRLRADTLAAVDQAGTVTALDVTTGTTRWRSQVGASVGGPAVPAGDAIVIADGTGRLSALDVADGSLRWRQEIDAYAGAAGIGDIVVVAAGQEVIGIGVGDGAQRWRRPYDGTFASLTAITEAAVLSSRTASYRITVDGSVTRLAQPYPVVTSAGQATVGWGKRTADLIDASGAVVARLDLPVSTFATPARRVVAVADGVLLMGQPWGVLSWGTGPS